MYYSIIASKTVRRKRKKKMATAYYGADLWRTKCIKGKEENTWGFGRERENPCGSRVSCFRRRPREKNDVSRVMLSDAAVLRRPKVAGTRPART